MVEAFQECLIDQTEAEIVKYSREILWL